MYQTFILHKKKVFHIFVARRVLCSITPQVTEPRLIGNQVKILNSPAAVSFNKIACLHPTLSPSATEPVSRLGKAERQKLKRVRRPAHTHPLLPLQLARTGTVGIFNQAKTARLYRVPARPTDVSNIGKMVEKTIFLYFLHS